MKTLSSATFDFLFFLHSAQMHRLIVNFYSWNQPVRMCEMLFTRLIAISHSLCKAPGISLCCTFTRIRLLYIAKIRTWIILSSKKYFIFLKSFLNSLQGIWQGQLIKERDDREDSSPGRTQPAPLLQTQKFRRQNGMEFLVVSDCAFNYFYIL